MWSSRTTSEQFVDLAHNNRTSNTRWNIRRVYFGEKTSVEIEERGEIIDETVGCVRLELSEQLLELAVDMPYGWRRTESSWIIRQPQQVLWRRLHSVASVRHGKEITKLVSIGHNKSKTKINSKWNSFRRLDVCDKAEAKASQWWTGNEFLRTMKDSQWHCDASRRSISIISARSSCVVEMTLVDRTDWIRVRRDLTFQLWLRELFGLFMNQRKVLSSSIQQRSNKNWTAELAKYF